ncbi:NOL1/NOP2/sun domain protein [Purpureocillium lavendulum]|uniref:NOL1/NOP2/sun domain protein n=1 Tax=Purpureocillium lavendulum TaxID=1247861 RepID=A0AB34G4S1_9HYPO|nr:NOL1/NOP2/sun domain protein [Purpureocillium lavendulum]
MSLYHEAAEILASSPTEGGSLKSRVFRKKNIKSSPNQLYALVLETSKWSPVLKEVVESSELLRHERKLTPTLSILLVHDLLLAKGGIALPQTHGLRASIERHKGRLTSEMTRARLRRKAPTLDVLREQIDKASAPEEANYPRWVRINALKSSIEEQLETTFSKYDRAGSVHELMSKPGKHLYIDPHVPNLVAVTSGTDLTKTEAYLAGKVILQDKASCFPAYLLDPRSEDGDVIDACAAPGNKTTHLAAIIHDHRPEFESPPQTIYAFEKDPRRAQTLEKMVSIAGSKKMTRIAFGQDFLQVDPDSERFQGVGALLLDPSCSGSGIVGRDFMPELHLPDPPAAQGKGSASTHTTKRKRKHDQIDEQSRNIIRDDDGNEVVLKSEKDLEARLQSLSSFQLTLLLHAFRFPGAKRVTYSTCSVHSQENEHVVMEALKSDIAQERGWHILTRESQVTGMREWPVRGLPEACEGNEVVANGCIRSYKDDGRGVMGFFVAAFVRDGTDTLDGTSGAEEDGPYLRDEDGRIVRDVLGMPVLKATGEPISLSERDEAGRVADKSDGASDEVAESVSGDSSDVQEEASDDGAEEWEGLGD